MVKEIEIIINSLYHNLDLSSSLGIQFGEETITDILLLEIAKIKSKNITLIKTSKFEEKLKGCDWEWFIGSNKRGWSRFAVQAKKCNSKTSRYDSISHKVGLINQIDILEKYAVTNNATPLYSYYNYPLNITSITKLNCCKKNTNKQLSWTYSSLKTAKKAINNWGCKNFNFIHSQPDTKSIKCLFSECLICCDTKIHKIKSSITSKKIDKLPKEFLSINKTVIDISKLPPEIYNHKTELYPKNICIIEH